MQAATPKRTSTWILSAVTLVAFALRVYRLGWPELRGDETFGLAFSAQSIPAMLQHTLQFLEPHPPLDYILLHVWSAVAGDSEWSLRFTSLVFGVLAVPLIYRLGALLHARPLGLWAAALFALNPFQLLHAQEARMYGISTALGLGAAVFLLAALRGERRRDWLGFVVLSAANAYTHYYALFLIAAFALYWLLAGPRQRWRPWLAAHVEIGLLYLPWLIVGWRVLTAYRGNGDSPAFVDMVGRSLRAFSLSQTMPPETAGNLLPLFALVFVIGVVALVRRQPSSALFLALYLSVPVLAVYASSLSRPVFNERYLAAAAPPFYLFLAAGIATLVSNVRRAPVRALGFGLAGILLAANLVSVGGYFFDPEFTRNRGWRELAAELRERAADGDVILQNYPDPTLWYYYRDDTPHAVVPETRPVDWTQTATDLRRMGEQYSRLWFVPYKSPDWDADGLVGLWLDRHMERVDEESVSGFALRQYRPARVALAEGKAADAVWFNLIALRGFDVEPSTDDETRVRPGDPIDVTFYWEALRPVPIDYTIFVHLQSTGGRIVAQRDSRPVRGTYPTNDWEPGTTVVDPYVIIVPADAQPGVYSISVGFYQASTGDRLWLGTGEPAQSSNRLVLPHMIVVE